MTQDAAPLLPRLLANLDPVADEIVAVDGGSRDGTEELLRAHPRVRYLARPFDTHGAQKNYAFAAARGRWILSVDTDELLSDELRAALPSVLRTLCLKWVKIPRYWLVAGEGPLRYVRAPLLYPDRTVRLFRNLPFFRYTAERSVHHQFPRPLPRRGLRLRRGHIFHLLFPLAPRAAREERVRRYDRLDPLSASISRQYLYEDLSHELCVCEEGCRELAGGAPAAGLGAVAVASPGCAPFPDRA